MRVQEFFDAATSTLTYVVFDEESGDGVVIDPVLDLDAVSGAVGTASLDKIEVFVARHDLRLHYALETHVHADHITGAAHLRARRGAKTVIGARVTEVQENFERCFHAGTTRATDGSQFDRLVGDGDVLRAGTLAIAVIATPGHTPSCVSYRIGDAVFTGDALFIEDFGTGRCDFPSGSAADLYASVHGKLYALPPATRVFVGHDYQPGKRPLRFVTTIGASCGSNVHLRHDTTRDEFIRLREARDLTLTPPRLFFPSVQHNVNAGLAPVDAAARAA